MTPEGTAGEGTAGDWISGDCITGAELPVRLARALRARDAAAGRESGVLIAGHAAPPFERLPAALAAGEAELAEEGIAVLPALSDALALAAAAGTQRAAGENIAALWWGGAAGLAGAGEALAALCREGARARGGVLLLAGEARPDVSAPPSAARVLAAAGVPVLVPADLPGALALGLHGWAFSRWSGGPAALALPADLADATVCEPPATSLPPTGPCPPEGGATPRADPSERAVLWVRAAGLDRLVQPAPGARRGIVALGPSGHDAAAALALLGQESRVRLLHLALAWPLDAALLRRFVQGLEDIVVLEPGEPLVEPQLRRLLYGQAAAPRLLGSESGLLPAGANLPGTGGPSPALLGANAVAMALARVWPGLDSPPVLPSAGLPPPPPVLCPGCPHAGPGAAAPVFAAPGCGALRAGFDPRVRAAPRGAWLGQVAFAAEGPVPAGAPLVVIGDAGWLEGGAADVRQAVAGGVSVTFRIVCNGVAAGRGTPLEVPLAPLALARELAALGVARIAVISESPLAPRPARERPGGLAVHPRAAQPDVEAAFRAEPGVSAVIVALPCTREDAGRAERETGRRVAINPALCDGCDACVRLSACPALRPAGSVMGPARRVDPFACTGCLACLAADCPALAVVEALPLPLARGPQALATPDSDALRAPDLPAPEAVGRVLLAGRGAVPLASLLADAARRQGLPVRLLAPLSPGGTGGVVVAHLALAGAARGAGLRAGPGEAGLLLGCELSAAASPQALGLLRPGVARIITDLALAPSLPGGPEAPTVAQLRRALGGVCGEAVACLDATARAARLLGAPELGGVLLAGFAWQQGALPLEEESLREAVLAAHGEAGLAALQWGRQSALAPDRAPPPPGNDVLSALEQDLLARRPRRVVRRWVALVERVREAEGRRFSGGTALTEAVARGAAAVLAPRDGRDLTRLRAAPAFRAELAEVYGEGAAWSVPAGASRWRGLGRLAFWRSDPGRQAHEAAAAQYEADVALLLERLSPGTLALATELAALPAGVRGYGRVRTAAEARAATARAALLRRLGG